MTMVTCFSSVVAANIEQLSVKGSSPNFDSNITGILLFRPTPEFWPERILSLSSSGLKFYLNIDFLLLSFIQVDHEIIDTAKNTVISPNFLVWKFCGKDFAFPQNFHTKKLGEITVFFAV